MHQNSKSDQAVIKWSREWETGHLWMSSRVCFGRRPEVKGWVSKVTTPMRTSTDNLTPTSVMLLLYNSFIANSHIFKRLNCIFYRLVLIYAHLSSAPQDSSKFSLHLPFPQLINNLEGLSMENAGWLLALKCHPWYIEGYPHSWWHIEHLSSNQKLLNSSTRPNYYIIIKLTSFLSFIRHRLLNL